MLAKKNILIIGCGKRAINIWIPLLVKSQCCKIYVYDINKTQGINLGEQVEFINKEDITAISKKIFFSIICSPPETHYSNSTYLSKLKINHIVETPFCHTVESAISALDIARENNVKLAVAENFIFSLDHIFIKKIINTNILGDLQRVNSYQDHLGFHSLARWLDLFKINSPEDIQIKTQFIDSLCCDLIEKFELTTIKVNNKLIVQQSGTYKNSNPRFQRPGFTDFVFNYGSVTRFDHSYKLISIFYKVFKKRSIMKIIYKEKNNNLISDEHLDVKFNSNILSINSNKLNLSVIQDSNFKFNGWKWWVLPSVYHFLKEYVDHLSVDGNLTFTPDDAINVKLIYKKIYGK